MTTYSVGHLHEIATQALAGQGFSSTAARGISEEFVVAELVGLRTHGVGKIASLNLGDLKVDPTLTEYGPIVAADGNRGNGFLLMRKIAELLIDKVREFGVGVAGARNFSRYSSLYPYTAKLAGQGFVGILLNSAGPAAVTPFGSIDPITGTNPVCFSFPTSDGIQTFDLATAEVVWGEIRQAALENRGVRPGPFLGSSGDVTTVPSEINAVRAFGGSKGWALNLAVEILGGLMVGGAAGLAVESEFDCGALMVAIDPARTGAEAGFIANVSQLFEEIRQARPSRDDEPVRVPGDRARARIDLQAVFSDPVEVEDSTIALLTRMAAGEKISELSSNLLFN
ncbi:Ldh family oxidoreductase [Parafrankia sp. FMc2]|uniref:Ldh family oxidoreductase n=1 Tax=Parafrankia sp. FMc2 TaxID=3233196 RepID=UPI0034D4F9B3